MMDFETWSEKQGFLSHNEYTAAACAWQAAQEAERTKILNIVERIGVSGDVDPWVDCAEEIINEINELDT